MSTPSRGIREATCLKWGNGRVKDIMGHKYGKLTAIAFVGVVSRQAKWVFQCDCGNASVSESGSVRFGKTNSCGCLQLEWVTRHGMTDSKTHTAWKNMIDRCSRPGNREFHNYGGRGIHICQRYKNDFSQFYADVGPMPSGKYTIDRIDNKRCC